MVVGLTEVESTKRMTMVEYLESLGYHFLGFDGGLAFYKDEGGRTWGSSKAGIVDRMREQGIEYE